MQGENRRPRPGQDVPGRQKTPDVKEFTKELTSIIERINTNKENKSELEKMVETEAFKQSFLNCFNIGGFAAPVNSTSAGNYRVEVCPVPEAAETAEDRWRLGFYIAIPAVSSFFRADSHTLWRPAKVIEIIAQWDKFYPLLEKTLDTDTKFINTIEKTIQNLKHLLAPEILSAGLTRR